MPRRGRPRPTRQGRFGRDMRREMSGRTPERVTAFEGVGTDSTGHWANLAVIKVRRPLFVLLHDHLDLRDAGSERVSERKRDLGGEDRRGRRRVTSTVPEGGTIPVFGLTQYFFGDVVLTCVVRSRDELDSLLGESQRQRAS